MVLLHLFSLSAAISQSASIHFVLTVVNNTGHIKTFSTDEQESPIQLIEGIPHIILKTGEYLLHNYTARFELQTRPEKIFNPHGFGALIDCENSDCNFSNDFPALQFTFAQYNKYSIYLGAHDAQATIKSFQGCSRYLTMSGPLEVRRIPKHRLFPVLNFPIVTEIIEGDYYDVAMRYKSFVFSERPAWLGKPIRESPLDQVQLWINTHWQEYDVFEKSGGKPESVLHRVLKVLDLLRDSLSANELALHWYEWDTLGFPVDGDYEGICDNNVRCGFDSHYPEYFPVRRNFESVVAELSEVGVQIFPYINGRIFDTSIAAWNQTAQTGAAKDAHKHVYLENYGNGVNFAVMCPATNFWHWVINDTVKKVSTSSVAGIYIDQVACASPVPCFDEKHDHPPGGGGFWTRGYREMMDHLRDSTPSISYVTESNVEQFIGSFDGFLTLQAFWDDTATSQIVPVFQAIYGGYIRTFGAIFHAIDLETDVFREKLALQFIFGAQLGWFSLVGSDSNAGFPNVGLLDALVDPENKPNVDFLKKLIRERRKLTRLFAYGNAERRISRFSQIWRLEGEAVTVSVNPYSKALVVGGCTIPPLDVVVRFMAPAETVFTVKVVL